VYPLITPIASARLRERAALEQTRDAQPLMHECNNASALLPAVLVFSSFAGLICY
jgi:hypothetical protein